MTVEEVNEHLAPKRRLELVFEKFEYYVAHPPTPGRPISDPTFWFCNRKLVTYSYRLTWKQYSERMEKTLALRGQPTEVFIARDLISLEDDGRVISHVWVSNGEHFSLLFSPTATEHSDKEKRMYPAAVGFFTANECTHGEPPDRNQMLPRIG